MSINKFHAHDFLHDLCARSFLIANAGFTFVLSAFVGGTVAIASTAGVFYFLISLVAFSSRAMIDVVAVDLQI